MVRKFVTFPWVRLDQKLGCIPSGLTAIVGGDAKVPLDWLSFFFANSASEAKRDVHLYTTETNLEALNHRYLTISGLAKKQNNSVTYGKTIDATGSITCVRVPPTQDCTVTDKILESMILDAVAVEQSDLIIADLAQGTTPEEVVRSYGKLNQFAMMSKKPFLLASPAPQLGKELDHLSALGLYCQTQIWITSDIPLPDSTQTLKVQVFSKRVPVCQFSILCDPENGNFFELPQ